MGKIVGNILHQWRKPLNNISLLTYFLRGNYYNEKCSKQSLYNNIIDIKLQISFASNTIDDVRKFYKLNKDKKSFSVL